MPTTFAFTGQGSIGILYDYVGKKLRKTVTPTTGAVTKQDYVDGIEYKTTGTGALTLEAIYHSEGRIPPNGANWQYEYSIKDHLGNTRITFADLNNNKVIDVPGDILQENHYYPFGMNMNYAWLNNMAQTDSKYQYNGKELNEDFGLNLYAYGYRYYDASIARFISVDPLAKNFPYLTTYQYASGNPVKNIDLDGLEGSPYTALWNSAGIYNPQQGIDMIKTVGNDFLKEVGKMALILGLAELASPILEYMLPEVEVAAIAPLAEDTAPVVEGATEIEQTSTIAEESNASGRASNNLKPDPEAQGDHTTFSRDQKGNVYKYQTYEKTPTGHDNPVTRFDGGKPDGSPGAPHGGVETPHMTDKGSKVARTPETKETPDNKRFKPESNKPENE